MTSLAGIVLLPGWRFFVRRITLVIGQDPVAQVELALETIGPFNPEQLYYGYCTSRDGSQALVFATYRKNFTAGDMSLWLAAHAVVPEFSVWLGQSAPVPAGVWLHEQGSTLTAIVWDGAGELPAGVISRQVSDDTLDSVRHDLLQEAGNRFGVAVVSPQTMSGRVIATQLGKEGLSLQLSGAGQPRAALLPRARLAAMDVRDKAALAGQHNRQKRDRLLWIAFASVVAGLAAFFVGEVGLQISRALISRQRNEMATQAAAVRKIEQANQLTVRLEELAAQSLRPFEMLTILNAARPATLEFIRASTGGSRVMEIEAQSGNAADPQTYEQALKQAAAVEKVELRDYRLSGGKTTFLVSVTFKPGFAGRGVGR